MTGFARFAELHRAGDPLVLFNAWDPGSARAIAAGGAPAIATGSWSVAAANGFDDGEDLPLDLALANAERIVRAVDLPVTIDFEGGYAADPDTIAANAARLAATGAVGCNVEDRRVGGEGRHPVAEQAARIAAMRRGVGADFFINARTDIFLQSGAGDHGAGIAEALERARAYAESGADGLFVPGLVDPALIGKVCEQSLLPVNVMVMPGAPDAATLASIGVARISHGPGPFFAAMKWLQDQATAQYRA